MRHKLANPVILLGGCLLLLACNRADQAQLTKGREEAVAAKAETAAANAELAKAQAELAKVRSEATPQVKTAPPAKAPAVGLAGSGVASFPDGTERRFSVFRGIERGSAGGVTATGIPVSGTPNRPGEFLSAVDADKARRQLPLHQIAQARFEPVAPADYEAFYQNKHAPQPTYPPFLEVTSMTGAIDRFRYDEADLVVTWADGLGETSYFAGPINYEAAARAESPLFRGVTFKADSAKAEPLGK